MQSFWRTPYLAGSSSSRREASMMVQSLDQLGSSLGSALMKRVLANRLCQASSVKTETFRRYFGSPPA